MDPATEVEPPPAAAGSLSEARYPPAPARLVAPEQLQVIAAGCASRAQFLSELTIDPPSRTSELAGPPLLDDDFVVLSTIHSAKGGEWDVVYVIHAADGNIPSDMSLSTRDGLEEERRLFYVALTRARDHLYLVHPQRFYDRRHGVNDPHSFSQPSRFLEPLAAVVDQPPPDHADVLTIGGAAAAGPDTVSAQLHSLWS